MLLPLQETRLGKLINDVRKKTKDQDLAKRAKKLLRNWQKLIEPGQAEATPRGAGLGPGTPGSANGAAHPPCRAEATPPRLSPELKGRNDFHNVYSPKAEKGRKRKGDARLSPAPPAKVAKATTAAQERICNSATPPPTNGVGGSPEPLPLPGETDALRAEPPENDKPSRIPVNAVRPRPGPAPSTSALLRAAVLQQHAKTTPPRPAPSPPPLTSPLPESSLLPPQTPPLAPPLLPQQEGSPPPPENAIGRESDGGGASGSERGGKRRKKKYRPRDYRVNLGGPAEGGGAKPVRLKERRLTFDPTTGQIRPLAHSREPGVGEEPPPHSAETLRTEPPPPQLPAPPSHPNPFQQTNWKELSRNEVIQLYLNMQSSVLTSSGAQTPGAHFFMSECLRREESHVREARKTHVLVPTETRPAAREVTHDDLRRASTERWPGVNGCSDTQERWYDWTQCISLDPHGDESRLHILPYVCLD